MMAVGRGVLGAPSMLCLLTGLCVVVAGASLITLFVAIWQCADLLWHHELLWQLSQHAITDLRLLHGLYLVMGLAVLGLVLLLLHAFSRGKGDEATGVSSFFQVLCMVVAVLILLGHMTSAILVGVYRSQTLPQLRPALLNILANQTYMLREPLARWIYMDIGEKFNYLQVRFSCCGIDEPGDYATLNFPGRHEGEAFPYSCCHLKEGSVWTDPDLSDVRDLFLCQSKSPDAFHSRGCLPMLRHWLQSKADFLLGCSLFLMFLTALLMALTVYVIYNVSGKPF